MILWAMLTFTSLCIRPLMPVDETRYASVAWEMWVTNDFLVPHLNGETYSHKPPLLFWLMQLSWWIFGVNEWSLRIISPLFALATLFLTREVAKLIWPECNDIAGIAPFLLLGSGAWIAFSTLTMFDIMLTFFVLLGIYGLLRIVRNGWSYRRLILVGIAIGSGVLTKGPVVLLHLLPVALSAPWWLRSLLVTFSWKRWYGGILFAVILGALIALSWAIPAGFSGGEAYRNAIFLGQTSGRIVDSFAHKLPVWWYLEILPLFMLPWMFIPPCWIGLRKLDIHDFGVRFCAAWLLPVFVAFSLISGKRIHYLLPLLPGMAILTAYSVNQLTAVNWRKANVLFFVFLFILGLALLLFPWLNSHFHWRDEFLKLSVGWGLVFSLMVLLGVFVPINNVKESISFVATTSVVGILILASGFFSVLGERYDAAPAAKKIAELQQEKTPFVMYVDKYHGQFNFTGRLKQPMPMISNFSQILEYAKEHPDDFVVVTYEKLTSEQEMVFLHRYPLKSHTIGFIKGQSLVENPQLGNAFLR